MLTSVNSMSLIGVEGQLINVEIDISNGLPSWEIVGLPDASVRESKERVRTAIKNSGYKLDSRKFVINLAPASTRKEGSAYDLAIAIGILNNLKIVKNAKLEDYVFIGELSLNGNVNKINGVLPMCIEARKIGIKNIIVPYDNREEAGLIAGINVIPVSSLNEVVMFLNDPSIIKKYSKEIQNIFDNEEVNLDFLDIKGQNAGKKVMEIVAAGNHNCLLVGSPRFWENYAC